MNLAQGIHQEMNRVRKAIAEYESLPGGAGMIGAALMKLDIQKSENAIASGDVVEMLSCYARLKEIEYEE